MYLCGRRTIMPDSNRVIEKYSNSPAICQDYDPRAPEVAQIVAQLITTQLPTLTVEHIGSTAVEGCVGKGIVDIMLLFPEAEGSLEDVKQLLERLGFQRQTTRDPSRKKGQCGLVR
jgi:GrpB-like predicted nucleotidyltransferase (UPF0157 family)